VPTILKYRCLYSDGKQFRIGHRSCHRRIWNQQRTSFCRVIGLVVPALIALVNVAFGFEKNTIQPLHKFKSSYNTILLSQDKWVVYFSEPFPSYAVFRCENFGYRHVFLKKNRDAASTGLGYFVLL
jgi:hypothetical protein